MIAMLKSDPFDHWLSTSRDRRAVACINATLRHASPGTRDIERAKALARDWRASP